MLETFDLSRRKTAILQNAFDKVETTEINGVPTFQFKLPADDPKNDFCQPYHYVRLDGGPLYRIVAPSSEIGEVPVRTYQCEHVIATLIDDVIFGQKVIGNLGIYTADVIRDILAQQHTRNWVLDRCDFQRQFEYCFEHENLLAALFSVPNRFTAPYMWRFDTKSYPWKLSLVEIDPQSKPEYYIRAGRNLLAYSEEKAAQEICTKLYCLGYGEGVNQLTIADVNRGQPYLLADQEAINRYGLITRIWVDRRFEDPQSLMERGKAILAELQHPTSAKTFDIADLYELTNDPIDKAEIGKIAKFTEDGTTTYIRGITKNHDIPGDIQITLATKAVDVASTIADLADRQRIEQVYSQGATQIYAQSVQANATSDVMAKLNFYIPSEMRIVNAVKVKIDLSAFRSYSKSTSGGGGYTSTSSAGGGSTATSSSGGGTTTTSSDGGGSEQTSSSGGASTVTSSAGGGSSVTSEAGGGSSQTTTAGGAYTTTSSAGGEVKTTSSPSSTTSSSSSLSSISGSSDYTSVPVKTERTQKVNEHDHSYTSVKYANGEYGSHYHRLKLTLSHTHNIQHTHTINIPNHTHSISFPGHTHTIEIPKHKHDVKIPAHTHRISVPPHTHSIRIPNHNHTINVPSHTHSVSIPSHTHSVSIPNHTHDIIQGIFTFGGASGAALYVDGSYACEIDGDAEMDITGYLIGRDTGKIARGSWHSIEVKPNSMAYVTIDMMIQGFIQSRGGNTV